MANQIIVLLTTLMMLFTFCNLDEDPSPLITSPLLPDTLYKPLDPVDMSNAVVVGDGTAQSCTEEAIRKAIETADTILCNCGASPPTIQIQREIVLSKDLVFDGGSITFDGGSKTRTFRKEPAANQAAGLSFIIQNCSFTNGLGDSLGGAIYNRTFGTFTAINVSFSNNRCAVLETPDWGGGAVYSLLQREVIFSNCTFTNNSGANGGAIGGIGNSMTIINCSFENNRATGKGGGADVGPTGKGGIGGAIYIDNVNINGINAYLRIAGSSFKGNRSNDHAGALFTYFIAGSGSSALIDRCLFSNNAEQVTKAGAIYHQNGTLLLANSTFTGNRTPTQGAGLWTHGAQSIITNSTFHDNAVTKENGLGGAYCLSQGSSQITHCTFANNSSTHFAAAIMNSGTLTIVNTLFYNNTLDYTATNHNAWAGVTINKGSTLSDGSGNMQWPISYQSPNNTMVTDEWLNENPNVMQDDAQLQSLADNGGPTLTMALPSGSPAINKGVTNPAIPIDQRGESRDASPDIGAFEF